MPVGLKCIQYTLHGYYIQQSTVQVYLFELPEAFTEFTHYFNWEHLGNPMEGTAFCGGEVIFTMQYLPAMVNNLLWTVATGTLSVYSTTTIFEAVNCMGWPAYISAVGLVNLAICTFFFGS